MARFNAKEVAHFKELAAKSQYMMRKWTTDEESTMSLSEYSELINPAFKHIDGNPIIIAKETKKGGVFLKMWISLGGESGAEYDLSYENDFEEGDEIEIDSLSFCVEKFMDMEHMYATGNVL